MGLSFKWTFVGLENFKNIPRDPIIPQIIRNTFIYVFFTLAVFNVGMAILLSLLTTSISDKWGGFFRTLWMLPRITPSVVYGLLWLWIFDPSKNGLLNVILSTFGMPPQDVFHHNPMLLIVFANGFVGASMGMMIFSAAIKAIPVEYYRAAMVDGVGWFTIVRKITLPLIRWHLLFITAYETLSLFTSYQYILIITNGGPVNRTNVWALYTYQTAFSDFKFGYGAALSLVLVAVGIIAGLLYIRNIRVESANGNTLEI
jgi:inositol-phosphate transport system permease protein